MREDDDVLVMVLRGRLGNQLFQWAAGVAIAKHLDVRLRFDCRRVDKPDLLLPRVVPDHFERASDHDLDLVCRRSTAHRRVSQGARRWWRATVRRSPLGVTVPDEAWSEYDERLFRLNPPVAISGFLMNERYFDHIATEIAGGFRWPDTSVALPDEHRPAVAVSFRRGDYNSLGWALPLSYYDQALEAIAARVDDPTFVVFGDDAGFVEMFTERARRRHGRAVDGLELGHDAASQLRLQSECDHAVIANSSFAWWGAWLGDQQRHDDRVVIMPLREDTLGRAAWVRVPMTAEDS